MGVELNKLSGTRSALFYVLKKNRDTYINRNPGSLPAEEERKSTTLLINKNKNKNKIVLRDKLAVGIIVRS